ncbi:uncharacterized protein si:dkey-191c17.2 [Ctenopharyngodon idella]|uniref:uncharacterized protein si:dkey-191c17.2 n=1 Tax=Ctenopharyngodon idella TaxID=7959 RepID=UPI00222FA7C2|nr:uncharacterized protein si:dkey-191c17.2 [Ctenopharyngodon idella]
MDENLKVFEDTMQVPVKIEYELGEQTEQRLREMGVHCVGETLDVEYYYDTDSFQLASTQTWLNQHNGQWGLILPEEGELNHAQSDDTKKSKDEHFEEKKSKILNSSPEEKSATGAALIETSSNNRPEKKMCKIQVQRTSSATSPTYTELSDPHAIMSRLSKCLQLPLTHNKMQSMTMKNFLKMAQIQMYDSWTRTSKAKYSLPGGFSLVVERNYRIPTETPSAFLMMNADVLSISSELEKMDRLCKELGLKPKAKSLQTVVEACSGHVDIY